MKKTNQFVTAALQIPILKYTSVVEQELDDMRYCTSAAKLERDLRQLLENGYEAISISKYIAIRNGEISCPEKAVVIVFVGGYENNYSVAFPILKSLRIPASVFIATELVGMDKLPHQKEFAPHFGWSKAQEMIDSGLVNIYPMWHPFDKGKDFSSEVTSKLMLLESNLSGNGEILAFSQIECSTNTLDILNGMGIEINLSNFGYTKQELLERGAVPTIEVLFSTHVMDVVDRYRLYTYDAVKNNEMESDIRACCSVPDESILCESVMLPIDHNPRARNYLRHAFAFSVLQTGRMDKVDAILMREYIDLIYQPQTDWLDYHNESYEHWKCFSCRRMSRDILVANGMNIIAYLINGLKSGYYADIWLDTYYIPGKTYYQKVHSKHGLLFYGYDAEKRVFNALSYNKREQYEKFEVSLQNVSLACMTPYFGYVTLFKNCFDEPVEYDFDDVCKKLQNYLYSVSHRTYHRFAKYVPGQSEQYEACLQFAKTIYEKALEKGSISQVAMYSYGEHKRLMMWRLRTLAEREKIVMPELSEAEKQTYKATGWLLYASVKYNMTHENALLDSIERVLDEQNAREKEVLERFLKLANMSM